MVFEDWLHPLLSRYIGSPQWVKSSLGHAYASLPLALRRGPHFSRFLAEAGVRDPAALAQLQRDKLTATLRWALQTVPFYQPWRGLLAQLGDPYAVLARLPLVGKEQLKRELTPYLSHAISPKRRLETFTGGSTANPLRFYLHKGVSRVREYAYMDDFHRRVGLGERDLVLALRGRTVPSAREPGGKLWMYEPIKQQLMFSCDHLERDNMPAYVAALRHWRPRFIQAYPSALYPLARWLQEHPEPELQGLFQGVLLYSENVYGYQMQLFRQVFGCPVLKHYGQSERVLMAASLPDDERYVFWPQYGQVELVDDQGKVITTPGVLGEVVGTAFDNQVLPFIRYRTGDLAMYSAQGHPDLPGYPVMERIEGRLQEFIVCRDRRLVSICTMGAAHFDELAQVDSLQYEQHRPGHCLVKVVTRVALAPEAQARIVRAIEDKTQGGCSAELVMVDAIPRTQGGKHRMLLQHLDLSPYFGASLATEEEE